MLSAETFGLMGNLTKYDYLSKFGTLDPNVKFENGTYIETISLLDDVYQVIYGVTGKILSIDQTPNFQTKKAA